MFPCSFKAPSRNMHKMNEYLRNVLLTPKLKKKTPSRLSVKDGI